MEPTHFRETHSARNEESRSNMFMLHLLTFRRICFYKVHPRKGYESPEEYSCGSSLSSTEALDVGGWAMPRPGRFTPWERHPLTIVCDVRWALGSVWAGVENLAPTGDRSPDQ